MLVSIGLFAWNEEHSIAETLKSLFDQSLFHRVEEFAGSIEVFVVANGCTDRTVAVARETFSRINSEERFGQDTISFHVVTVAERGKAHAWNVFVHEISSKQADYMFLMDADILFNERQTLWSMLAMLGADRYAQVSTDNPMKKFRHAGTSRLARMVSRGVSRMTQAGSAQLTGQLYCIRSAMARRIRLPRSLLVEDGFIKTLVCTNLLTTKAEPKRIVRAKNASHTFIAYTKLSEVINNQKRQKIGNTITYYLCDVLLPNLLAEERLRFAQTVAKREAADPDWCIRPLKEYIAAQRWFWTIYPDATTYRLKQLMQVKAGMMLKYLSVSIVGMLVDVIACYRAHKALREDRLDFWPDTQTRWLPK